MKRLMTLMLLVVLTSNSVIAQKDIFEVARFGSSEEVKALMVVNADTINIADQRGFLPLTLACYNGNLDVVKFLASKVKFINGESELGTSLMAAAYKNELEIVKVLLKNKANPDLTDAHGTTALHFAVINRNEIMVEDLIKFGADKELKDNRGKTALDYAILTEEKEIIELLKKKSL